MTVTLTGQAQDLLGQTELVVITERVDDVALLLGQMMQMGLPEILDTHLPPHRHPDGLSWGWTAVIWLAHILSEGDHRKVAMEAYVTGMKETLSQVTGQSLRVLDFSDDRLAHVLNYLSQAKYWHPIEQALNERSVTVYDLATEVIRCDATTVSAGHAVVDGGLVQFGHSKDDPGRPQIKLMTASLDPLGVPLATNVLSGEKADDGLYVPILERVFKGLGRSGLVVVGDCKMSAFGTRTYLAGTRQYYLSPLPLIGETAKQMPQWISEGLAKSQRGEVDSIVKTNDQGQEVEVAQGYEIKRVCKVKDPRVPGSGKSGCWSPARWPMRRSRRPVWSNAWRGPRRRFML